MSEYIVAGAEPNNTVLKSITKNGYEHEMWLPVREEIVRCRDCRYFHIGTNTDCCVFTEKYAHPYGFCSWGEKKGDAE